MARTEIMRWRPAQPPSRVQRLFEAIRSYTLGPYTLSSLTARHFADGGPSSSGVMVNEETALSNSAVWAAVSLIADDVSSLPLLLYKQNLEAGTKVRFYGHPLYRILHDTPNSEMSSMVARRVMQLGALLWGNGYAEIEWNGAGLPVAYWPLSPDRMTTFRDRGVLKYRYQNEGRQEVFDAEDIIHIQGLGPDGSHGYNLVQKARESIALGLAAERFGGTFYGQGASVGGVISFKGPKPTELSEKSYREQFEARHQGVRQANKILMLYNDAKYEQTVVAPNNAQFLETRVFQVREIARYFKLPPHKLGDLADATFSNVEQQNLDYFTSCLRPWLQLWEEELEKKLIAKSEMNIQSIEHVTQGLLAADAAGRAALHSADFNTAAVTPNEIRAHENRNPIAGGDRTFVNLTMMPLDRLDEWVDAQIKEKTAPKTSTPAPAPPTEDQINSVIAAMEAREDRIVTEAEARSTAEAKADTFQREAAAAREALTEARQALADATAAHEALRVQLEAALSDEQAQRATDATLASDALTEALGQADVASKTRDALQAQLAALELAHEGLSVELTEAKNSASQLTQEVSLRQTAVETAEAALTTEREARALTEAATTKAEAFLRAECEVRVDVLTQQLEAAQASAENFESQATAAHARWSTEHDAYEAKLTEEFEKRALVEAALEQVRTERQVAEARAETVAALHEVSVTAHEMLEQQYRATAETLQQFQAETRTQRSHLPTLYRALFVDAMGRMVRREVANAKSYQATPAKLRTWMQNFYDETEGAIFTEALLPSVRLHLSWIGSDRDPESYVRELVRVHFDESIAKFSAIIDGGPDGFGALLQRLLDRWTAERAERFADALVNEEIAYYGR